MGPKYDTPTLLGKAIVTSVRDITLNRTIEEENKKFKLAIQHSHEVIFMTDTKGVINYINPQFEKFYQYKSDQIIGKTPKLLKSGQKSDEFYSEFWQNLMEGNNLNIEFENKTQNGDIVTVEESISSYFDDNNEIAGFISIQRDISEKKQNEELIRRALDKAEESDNLKAAFLNQMSHEIRTPLNSILGFMSLMEEELINRGVKDLAAYFDSVNRSALRLQRTIENILAMSNIQVGNYFTSFTKIDLESVLKLILEDFKSLAEEKNIEIIFENNTTEAAVFADSYTIIQSFQHLLDNAFKFTNSGKVEVKMFNVDDAVCVNIKDTGIGISKEYMEKLFKPFSQEEVGYGRSYDGNGLGLALAKEYLRLNYANISVKSEKGKGSVFTVTFYNVKEESES
jgi:PAS domain S-box-containing protein